MDEGTHKSAHEAFGIKTRLRCFLNNCPLEPAVETLLLAGFYYPITTRYFLGLPVNLDKTGVRMMAFDVA